MPNTHHKTQRIRSGLMIVGIVGLFSGVLFAFSAVSEISLGEAFPALMGPLVGQDATETTDSDEATDQQGSPVEDASQTPDDTDKGQASGGENGDQGVNSGQSQAPSSDGPDQELTPECQQWQMAIAAARNQSAEATIRKLVSQVDGTQNEERPSGANLARYSLDDPGGVTNLRREVWHQLKLSQEQGSPLQKALQTQPELAAALQKANQANQNLDPKVTPVAVSAAMWLVDAAKRLEQISDVQAPADSVRFTPVAIMVDEDLTNLIPPNARVTGQSPEFSHAKDQVEKGMAALQTGETWEQLTAIATIAHYLEEKEWALECIQ